MRRLYKAALHLILLWGVSLSAHGSACMTIDAKETTPSRITYELWDHIGEFCDVGTLKNLSLCSHDTHTYPQQHLRELKEWKDGGGLITVMFGAATDEDKANYFRLKGSDTTPLNMSAVQIKDLLLSFVYIADVNLSGQLPTRIDGYIQSRTEITDRNKHILHDFLPNSTPLNLCHWLIERNYKNESYPDQSLQLTDSDRQKVFLRILKLPRQVAERSNEISGVLSYIIKTRSLNSKMLAI